MRGEFTAAAPPPFVWLDGGRRYAMLTQDGAIVVYETQSGESRTVVAAPQLVGRDGKPLRIDSFSFSPDGAKVLVFANTVRVWRNNTKGDYWVFDIPRGTLKKLAADAAPSSLLFAKFSPDGRRVAYVRDNNIHIEDIESGEITPLTRDGAREIINGTSDWVNEEELFLRDCFQWSPDGRRIAYWQFDTSGVGRFTLINNTDSTYPTLKEFAYPKAGTRNSAVRLGVVSASGGETAWLNTPGDAREFYIPRMQWRDADSLVFTQLARRQNAITLFRADVKGNVYRLHSETSSTWVDAGDPLVAEEVPVRWLPGDQEFTWISDKSGWRHVYAVNATNAAVRELTRFDADALSIVSLDRTQKRLYFIASPENATQRFLYASKLDDGTVSRVTPKEFGGTNAYSISPDGRWALHTHSRLDVPPQVTLVSLPDHRVWRTLVDNSKLAGRVAPMFRNRAEFTQVPTGEGVTVDGLIVKPATFNSSSRYPVVVFAYTEPATLTVEDRWVGARTLFHLALADQGYVVTSFDNRGTAAPKGARWRKVVYGSLGDLSTREQAEAIRALATQRPYIDLMRVGMYGSSGGGIATLNAMFRHPDLYKVGVAIAPGPDQRLYDTIYQERYMGLPEENPDGYKRGSPIHYADGLRGRLLLMHGTGDDNVHLQQTERLVNRLIELGKDFDEVLYPNRTHSLSEGRGTTYHRWRTTARYFLDHLPAGAR
jgi:dipeptidyl-peptidase-4